MAITAGAFGNYLDRWYLNAEDGSVTDYLYIDASFERSVHVGGTPGSNDASMYTVTDETVTLGILNCSDVMLNVGLLLVVGTILMKPECECCGEQKAHVEEGEATAIDEKKNA